WPRCWRGLAGSHRCGRRDTRLVAAQAEGRSGSSFLTPRSSVVEELIHLAEKGDQYRAVGCSLRQSRKGIPGHSNRQGNPNHYENCETVHHASPPIQPSRKGTPERWKR